jgi:hypothetical protein
MSAPRCHARSKRTGLPCRQPAVRGWSVCRMHGARGGAPKGDRNGMWRHGRCSNESLALFRFATDKARRLELMSRLIDAWHQGAIGPEVVLRFRKCPLGRGTIDEALADAGARGYARRRRVGRRAQLDTLARQRPVTRRETERPTPDAGAGTGGDGEPRRDAPSKGPQAGALPCATPCPLRTGAAARFPDAAVVSDFRANRLPGSATSPRSVGHMGRAWLASAARAPPAAFGKFKSASAPPSRRAA